MKKRVTIILTTSDTLGCLLLGGVLLLDLLLLRSYAVREITENYPTNFDQASYLTISYSLYEEILRDGFVSGIRQLLSHSPPQGILVPLQAALLWLAIGASRLGALTLNFVYFLSLQLTLIFVLHSLTRTWTVPFLGLGLLLTTSAPFFWAGGIMDFRLDFIGLCLFGIFISVVIQSKIFLSSKYSLLAACIASLLILSRYIMTVYVGFIWGVLFVYLLVAYLSSRRTSNNQRNQTVLRLKNLLLFQSLIVVIVFSFLWLARRRIYAYYFVGHVTGDEKHIRALEQGVYTLRDNLLFYPVSIFGDHIGRLTLIVSVLILTTGAVVRLMNYRLASRVVPSPFAREGFIFLLLCFIGPILVLTLDISKSPVAGNVVMPAFLWLVLWTFLCWTRETSRVISGFDGGLIVLTSGVLFFGLCNQVARLGRHDPLRDRDHIAQVVTMYTDIGRYSERVQWREPRLSVDRIRDYLGAKVFSAIYYEKTGTLLEATKEIGKSIFSITKQEALAQLKRSDIAILSEDDRSEGSVFPFDAAMAEIRPLLRKAVNAGFVLLGRYRFDESVFSVYVRPDFLVSGISGDWITRKGVVLSIPGEVVNVSSAVVLQGESNFSWISPQLKVFARVIGEDTDGVNLDARITVSGQEYSIACAIPPDRMEKGDTLRVALTFSDYFVPRELSINEDVRELVIMAPTKRTIIPR